MWRWQRVLGSGGGGGGFKNGGGGGGYNSGRGCLTTAMTVTMLGDIGDG